MTVWGLRFVDENKSDGSLSIIILDVMMPDIDGFQVLQKIRETTNIPVLMLTAKDSNYIHFTISDTAQAARILDRLEVSEVHTCEKAVKNISNE